jgi:hypothetical protein
LQLKANIQYRLYEAGGQLQMPNLRTIDLNWNQDNAGEFKKRSGITPQRTEKIALTWPVKVLLFTA